MVQLPLKLLKNGKVIRNEFIQSFNYIFNITVFEEKSLSDIASKGDRTQLCMLD